MIDIQAQEDALLNQLASTEAAVWSPYSAHDAVQILSDLLAALKREESALTFC
ncbi:MAG: hypothetical protein WA885_19130 [Phormidesmis sp.]